MTCYSKFEPYAIIYSLFVFNNLNISSIEYIICVFVFKVYSHHTNSDGNNNGGNGVNNDDDDDDDYNGDSR